MLFSILENLIYYIFHLSLIISNKLLINILIIIKHPKFFHIIIIDIFIIRFVPVGPAPTDPVPVDPVPAGPVPAAEIDLFPLYINIIL